MAAQGAVVRHGASPSPRMRHCSARGSKRRLRVACTAAAEAQPAQQPSTSLAALPPEGTSALVTQPAPAEAVLATRPGKRTAVLAASKTAAQLVTERARPLEQYMTLPASQYSLLDAQRVERLDDSTFRCYVGSLQFFSLQVEPVITVQVTVEERGPTVRLLSAKLQGSKVIEAVNDKFSATMLNRVRWREAAEGNGKEIVSDASIQVILEVPSWFFLPTSSLETTGNVVMSRVLESAVPRFLKQLTADYDLWAAGQELERQQLEASGNLLGLEIINSDDE